MRVDVGSVEDFREGSATIVRVQGREVGVIRWQGHWYAMRNACPHMGGPVCGGVGPKLVAVGGPPGSMDVEPDIPVMQCAWHGWEFDVRTGRAVWDADYGVRVYPVVVQDARVFIDVTAGGA